MEINNYLEGLEFDLFEKIKHIPYIKLLESYIRNYNEDKLALMALQYLSTMPEDIQMEVVNIMEIHFFSSYLMKQTEADCDNALTLFLQTSNMADTADKYKNNNLDENDKQIIMTLFRVIALSHAHLASKYKEVRKALRIRKGVFFR